MGGGGGGSVRTALHKCMSFYAFGMYTHRSLFIFKALFETSVGKDCDFLFMGDCSFLRFVFPYLGSHQKEGEIISGVEILNILNTNSTRFVRNFPKIKKNFTIGIVSKPKSF